MKLLGFHNNNQIVASIAHYDYRSIGDGENYALMDGGQPFQNGGFYRCWGKKAWFEVPQTFAELYNDWNTGNPRRYGVWNLADVRLLLPEEIPDSESFEFQTENAIWGTNGPNGKNPTTYVLLKDCELEHLKKITKLLEARKSLPFAPKEIEQLIKIANHWIAKKCQTK